MFNQSTLARSIGLGLVAASGYLLAPVTAHASPKEGVRCPAGFTASITDGNKKLVCFRERSYNKASICSPVAFGAGKVALNTNITMDPTGTDQCLAVGAGTKVESVMAPPLPGEPAPSEFRRFVNATGPDTFVANVKEFEFPQGALPYNPTHDRSKGVRCPAGFDGDAMANGNGIRCDKTVKRTPMCQNVAGVGWTLEVKRDAFDVCNGPLGAKGPTKPEGEHLHSGRDGDGGWDLVKDGGRGSEDQWRKGEFRYPESSN